MNTAPENFVQSLQESGLGGDWEWKHGSWWQTPEGMDVRATAERMNSLDARFVAITSTERPDKEIRLDYQWDLNGQLLTFITSTVGMRSPASLICAQRQIGWSARRANTLPSSSRDARPPGL